MKRRLITVVLFAVLAALAVSTFVYRVIAARETTPSVHGPLAPVAARDLAVGALIQSGDWKWVEWTGPVDPQWVLRKEDITGRGVTASINRGEPIPENRLAPKGAGAGLASIIPAGLRAAAVRVDEVVGVSGYVLPGMHVDVLSSGTPPGVQGTITRTILQNIEVLSAGQNLERDAQGKPASVQVVNLLVTPEDAEKLSLASSQMKLQLVLRNPLDAARVKTAGDTTSGLLLDARPAVEHAPQADPKPAPKARPTPPRERKAEPAPPVMEIIHGSKKAAIVFGQ